VANNKVAIYTALFGNYDDLIEPKGNFDNCDFICFTDQRHLKSQKWKIIFVDVSNENDPVYLNRKYKFLPHEYLKEYNESMYVDANIQIINNPFRMVLNYLNTASICIPKHFERDCIYEEISQCILLNKVSLDDGNAAINELEKNGYPKKIGLGENNIIIRRHNNPDVIFLMERWWSFFNQGAKRDQFSLLYLSWKYNVKITLMNETSRNRNEYFRYHLHRSEKKLPLLERVYLYMKANRFRHPIYDYVCRIYACKRS